MVVSRYRTALTKMVPGTLGGRAWSATPVAARRKTAQPQRPFSCELVPVAFSFVDVAGIPVTMSTPDGSTFVVLEDLGAGSTLRSTYTASTLTLLSSHTYGLNELFDFDVYANAADDGYYYWTGDGNPPDGDLHLWRAPINGSAVGVSVASFSDFDTLYGFGAMKAGGLLYLGGSDNFTSAATLYVVDLSTFVRTTLHVDNEGYLSPEVVAPDGSVWGYFLQFSPSFGQFLFRYHAGTFTVMGQFDDAETADQHLFVCSDSSVLFGDGDGNGVRVTSGGSVSHSDCFDGFFFNRDFTGTSGPHYLVLGRPSSPSLYRVDC